MKFLIDAQSFSKHFGYLAGVVPSAPIVPALENLLIVADDKSNSIKITASDLAQTVTVKYDTPVAVGGQCLVPAKMFFDTLRQLSGTVSVTAKAENYEIVLSTDTGKYKMSGEAVSAYPTIPSVDKTEQAYMSGEQLHLALWGRFACSTDAMKPALEGIALKSIEGNLQAFASDSHRLTNVCLEGSLPVAGPVIIPRKAADLLAKILPVEEEKIEISFTDRNLEFEFGDTRIISRRIDEMPPAFESVLRSKAENVLSITAQKDELVSLLKRFLSFANRQTNQIKISILQKEDVYEVVISTEDLDFGNEAREVLQKAQVSVKGLPQSTDEVLFEIGVNAKFLADILNHLPEQDVELCFAEPSSAIMIYSSAPQYTCLIMPIMLYNYSS